MTVERPVKVRAANYLLLASALATEVASATGCLPRPTPISPELTPAKPEPKPEPSPSPEPIEVPEPTAIPTPTVEAPSIGDQYPEWLRSSFDSETGLSSIPDIRAQQDQIQNHIKGEKATDYFGTVPGKVSELHWKFYPLDFTSKVETSTKVALEVGLPAPGSEASEQYPPGTIFTFANDGSPIPMSPAGTDENGDRYVLTYDHQLGTFIRKTPPFFDQSGVLIEGRARTLAILNLETGQWETVEAPPIEQVTMTGEEIQTNVDAFIDMPQAEFDKKAEELCFHRGVENPGLGFITTGVTEKPDVIYYKHGVQGVLLGIQQVRDIDSEKDVVVVYLGTQNSQGKRVIIPVVLGGPAKKVGYYIADFEGSENRALIGGYTDQAAPLNYVLSEELNKRIDDIIVVKLYEVDGEITKYASSAEYIVSLINNGSSDSAAEIARQLQESTTPGFFDQFGILSEEVSFVDLTRLPFGSNFFMSKQIGSFLPQD